MKPANGKRLKTQTAVSRARMLIKQNLEWLSGFVVCDSVIGSRNVKGSNAVWLFFANDRQIKEKVITREDIRNAESTVKKLVYQFPRALPKIVGDVGKWQSRMDFTLGLCKNWVHENDAPQFTTVLQSGLLPGRWLHRWRQAMKSYPELRDLLVSLAYLELTGLQAPSLDAIQWVEENAEPLVKLSSLSRWNITQKLSFQFSMWHARHELPRDMVAKLAEVVSNHDVFHCPSKDVFLSINECRDRIKKMTEERRDGLESRASLSSKTPSQRSSLGPQVYKTYFQTLEAKPKEQPRLFQLLNLWLTPRFIRNASDTKNKIEKFEKRWYRLLRQIEVQRQLPESFFDRLSELNSETDSFESESKQVVDEIHQFCESMQKISPKREFNDSNAVDWFALLSPLPDNLRTGMFLRWTNFIERDFERCDDFTFIANQFARLLKRKRPSQSLIEHWQGVILENQDDVLALSLIHISEPTRPY